MKQSYRRQYPNMRFYPDDDLARLADKADRQRAKELDRLVTQEMSLSATELPLRDENRDEPYLHMLLKKFTRNGR